MRKLWVLMLLALLWPADAAAREIKDWMQNVFGCTGKFCVIRNSPGGIVERFEKAAREAESKSVQVRVEGNCHSMCAVFLSQIAKNVCLTKDAKIGLHMGFNFTLLDPDGYVVRVDFTTGKNVDLFEAPPEGYVIKDGRYVDLAYDKNLLDWAKANNKMPATPGVYILTWEEAMQFWKPCDD